MQKGQERTRTMKPNHRISLLLNCSKALASHGIINTSSLPTTQVATCCGTLNNETQAWQRRGLWVCSVHVKKVVETPLQLTTF
jgi:hypothetical protein